jgi:hypothetical protein
MRRGVVLYGPPGVGKHTIARLLGDRRPVLRSTDVQLTGEDGREWVRVLLWAPQSVVRQRSTDGHAAVAEWERCYADLVANPRAPWAVALRTDTVIVERAVQIIERAAAAPHLPAMHTVVLHRYLFR